MASITAAGTGSGLDIEKIIETLTEAEGAAEGSRLDRREIEIQADISAYGSLKGALADFQEAISGLSSLNELAARSTTSGNEDIFTATASSGAAVGNSQIQVDQLASNHKLVSSVSFADADTAVGAGTLTIGVGTNTFDVTITGGQNNTLAGIRNAINDETNNTGVTASILTVSDGAGGTESKLVLTSDESGEDYALSVSVTSDSDMDDTDNSGLSAFNFDGSDGIDPLVDFMTETSPAQDAKITIDGVFEAYSSSNVFDDAIEGVTITVNDADPANSYAMNVALDKTAISERLTTFVEAFNTLSDTLNFLTDYDIETQEAGLLTGDFAARTIETQLRRSISSVVESATGNFSSLASIGITTQRDGSLELDQTKLDKALNSNFDDVANLLASDDGVVKILDEKIEGFIQSDGVLKSRNETFLTQLKNIDEQRVKLEARVESFEERIRKQYTNMDILVSQLQSTGDFVAQQLDIIKAGITGKK